MSDRGNVQVQDLWVDLEEFHLREIDLDISPGEYFVILGPTGAGKTVLLETIAGLHLPQQGRIVLDGEDVTGVPPERRGIGFVYQDYMLFPHLSVAKNIAFGLKLRGLPQPAVEERVTAFSQLLGINHLLHRKPRTLSGGEQQRVALARALVVEPRILLLDEPLSALDPEMREGLQRELARVHGQLGTTTLHVTHDFEEAVALGERVAVLNEGRVIQVGPSDEIFRRPNSEFVARFVGVRNIFPGTVHRGENGGRMFRLDASQGAPGDADARGTEIAVVTDLTGPRHASIRPEDILISREPMHSSARNSFRGRIAGIVDRGTFIYVTVLVPPNFTCMITRRSLEELELREGAEAYIAFKASAVHVF